MRTFFVILTILVSWFLDTFRDAVQFGSPPGRWMKELWHVVKALSYAMPYLLLVWLAGLSLWWIVPLMVALSVIHEYFYPFFRSMEVWKWDEKWKVPLLNKVWKIESRKRDRSWS